MLEYCLHALTWTKHFLSCLARIYVIEGSLENDCHFLFSFIPWGNLIRLNTFECPFLRDQIHALYIQYGVQYKHMEPLKSTSNADESWAGLRDFLKRLSGSGQSVLLAFLFLGGSVHGGIRVTMKIIRYARGFCSAFFHRLVS